MATYRNVQMSFWTDPKVVDDFTPEDKYFYLYLLTNPYTKICGCYELSIRQMTVDTGYSKDTVVKLLNRLENVHNVIKFSEATKELLILNWPKYNWSLSPKVKKSIEDSIVKIKNQEFKDYLIEYYNSIDTLSIEYQYNTKTTDSLGIGIGIGKGIGNTSKNNNDKKEEEKKHLQEVDAFFERIWALYIRKEGKNGVTKAAKEEIFKVGFEKMEKCIQKYAAEKVGSEKRYILMGSTFFNGRYRDYLDEDNPSTTQINSKQLKRELQ